MPELIFWAIFAVAVFVAFALLDWWKRRGEATDA